MTTLDPGTREVTGADLPEPTDPRDVVAAVAGAALLAAGVIHLAVTPHHLGEAPLLGVAFLLLGLTQVGLALVVGRLADDVRALVGVLVLHVVVIALYVASRTVELPFMPPHDVGHEIDHLPVAGGVGDGVPVYPGSRIEQPGVVDVLCLVAELALVAAVLTLLPPRRRDQAATALVVLAVLGVVGRTVSAILG